MDDSGGVFLCGLSDLLQAVFRRNFLLFPPSLNFNLTWYATFRWTIHYFMSACINSNALMWQGKVHGSLARAGKVKSQTPKVAKQEKKKGLTGRAKKRQVYK